MDQSVKTWLVGVKDGDSLAAQRLHGAIYQRLLRLAKKGLGNRDLKWIDEDDVALSAFRTFCRRAEEGEFPKLETSDDLWKLLVRITYCKARNYLRKNSSQKRGGGKVVGEGELNSAQDASRAGGIDGLAGSEAPPDVALLVAEECERLLASLGDDTLAQVAIWKLEGYTDAEIALKLNCVTRTVERKLELIRRKWQNRLSKA